MVQYDPETLQRLDRRVWYGLSAEMVVGFAVLVAVVLVARPDSTPLVVLNGSLAVVTLTVGTLSLVLGDRVEAAGMGIAAVGWVAMGLTVAHVLPAEQFLYPTLALLVLGGTISLWADHGHRVRAIVGG